MTTNMITAARLIGHKSINGKYQTKMAMDKFPVLGHQMVSTSRLHITRITKAYFIQTHSLDTFLTDSANSASALYTGHKSTVNAMGVYADSSPDLFDDPKVETIIELIQRIWGSAVGAVSTATIADATPAALTGHSRSRYAYGSLVDHALRGFTNYTWTERKPIDVLFGGGAEQFIPGSGSYQRKDYYEEFRKSGYSVSLNKTSLANASTTDKALGIFCTGNLPVWLDRNIFPDYLKTLKNSPTGNGEAALDLPGLKEMTVKAVEILHKRGGDKGFFLMSEGASIDKQMHALDYDRALGDLLELDDTIRATIEKLKELGELEKTLIVVTADHGHGFDVFGSADTQYLSSKSSNREKRNAVGTYEKSGLSQYQVAAPGVSYNTGVNFPQNWNPRYTLAQGFGGMPDHREDYRVRSSPRGAATNTTGFSRTDMYVNPKDSPQGYVVNGTLPT
jgi:alkaline phosphatase